MNNKRKSLQKFHVILVLDYSLGMATINSLAHQPFEKLGQIPCETSVKKCVTGRKPHHILAIKAIFLH